MCYHESYNVLKLDFDSRYIGVGSPTVWLKMRGFKQQTSITDFIDEGYTLRVVQNKFSNRVKFTLHYNSSKICFSFHSKEIGKLFPINMHERKRIANLEYLDHCILIENILDELPNVIDSEFIMSEHEPKRTREPVHVYRNLEEELLHFDIDKIKEVVKKREGKSAFTEDATTEQLLDELYKREDISVSSKHDYETNLPIVTINQLENASDDDLMKEMMSRAESKLLKPLYKRKKSIEVDDDNVVTKDNIISFKDFVEQIQQELEDDEGYHSNILF